MLSPRRWALLHGSMSFPRRRESKPLIKGPAGLFLDPRASRGNDSGAVLKYGSLKLLSLFYLNLHQLVVLFFKFSKFIFSFILALDTNDFFKIKI